MYKANNNSRIQKCMFQLARKKWSLGGFVQLTCSIISMGTWRCCLCWWWRSCLRLGLAFILCICRKNVTCTIGIFLPCVQLELQKNAYPLHLGAYGQSRDDYDDPFPISDCRDRAHLTFCTKARLEPAAASPLARAWNATIRAVLWVVFVFPLK